MKSCIYLALAAVANAFPHMAKQLMEQVEKRAASQLSYTGFQTTQFDPKAQYVSNTGTHAYKAPNFAAGDIRGPCPGLNAAANHGYLNHNGVTTLLQAITGTNEVFGMGLDLGGFLSAYSVLTVGNPLTGTWSIGGTPGGQILLPGQGSGNGLSNSHNIYETDSSPMRGDLYEYGNDYKLQLSQFQEFYDMHHGEANPNFSFGDLVNFRSKRFSESVANNPNFFYGPFTGVLVSQAAFTFISAFMSNHSSEYPNGFLSRDTLKSFMGIVETGGTGNGDGTLAFNPGTEQIPNNWYKRAILNPYSIPAFQQDFIRVALAEPRILSVGGNTGTKNSFTGVDIGNLTGGVYNTASLTQGNNALCFAYQASSQINADALKPLTNLLSSTVNGLVGKYITPALAGCPQLKAIDQAQLEMFPGYTKQAPVV